MKKLILITVLFISFGATAPVHAQSKVNYTITAEAHALMCPFLSPKLMELLTKKGAQSVIKDEQLALHFHTTKKDELSDEFILKLVDEIGYEPKHFKIVRTYE
jgi:hypothetical protein